MSLKDFEWCRVGYPYKEAVATQVNSSNVYESLHVDNLPREIHRHANICRGIYCVLDGKTD